MAKQCNISVRTVQYYDERGLLIPSALSEGGRRIYSDEDLRRLKIICFLRELELPIDSIKQLFAEAHSERVIELMLDQQEKALRRAIESHQEKVARLESVRRTLHQISHFSIESIGDIARIMESRKQLRRMRKHILLVGLVMDVIEVSTIILWVKTGQWLPFAMGMILVIALGLWTSRYYFRSICYICPECHAVFKPGFKEVFWAVNTPNTRKLTCTSCGYHGFCVENYEKGA